MDAIKDTRRRYIRRGLSTVASIGAGLAISAVPSRTAGATSRQALATASATAGSGGVLLVLGAAVLVLGGIGFVVFTWTRRKRRPSQCAEQREALELAERTVRYWEGARAHLEAVEKERTLVDAVANDGPDSASLVAKAVEGLNTALKQRDQCQMDLILCMASEVPAAPVITPSTLEPLPFHGPDADGLSSNPPRPD